MPKSKFLTITSEAGRSVIRLTGFISEWENSSREICQELDILIVDPATGSIELELMNFYGGSVFEGFPIRNKIKSSPKPISAKAEGIVASMATVIFTACKTREIARGSRLVLHKPSVSMYGQSHQLRLAADNLDTVEKDLIACYVEDTGMSEEDIVSKFLQNDIDCFINDQDAVKYGLATGTYEGGIKTAIPDDVLKKSDLKAVASYFNQQIINSINQNEMKNLHLFAAILSMKAEDLTEDVILQKFQAMHNALETEKSKVVKLEAKVAEQLEASITSMLDAAVTAGKIVEADRENYKTLAQKDFEGVSKIIAGMPERKTITNRMDNPPSGSEGPEANWTYKDYLDNDKSGKKLEALQKSNPEKFKALKAAYGK